MPKINILILFRVSNGRDRYDKGDFLAKHFFKTIMIPLISGFLNYEIQRHLEDIPVLIDNAIKVTEEAVFWETIKKASLGKFPLNLDF